LRKTRGVLLLAAVCVFSSLAVGSASPTAFEHSTQQRSTEHLFWLRLRDGTVAQSLDAAGCCVSVSDVEPDGRGGWFVAGHFTSIGGVDCPSLVHVLASLRVDPGWCPFVSGGGVDHLARVGDTLYGAAYDGFFAVDTRTASVKPWRPAVGGEPEAIAAGGGRVFLGVSASDGRPTKSWMIAVDGKTGRRLRWNARFDNRKCGPGRCYVHFGALLVRGRTIYVAGSFRQVQGQKHIGLVALDTLTARPLPWRADVDPSTVDTGVAGADLEHWHLAAGGQTVYVSGDPIPGNGDFASINGVRRYGVAALDGRTGRVRRWYPQGGAVFDATPSAVVLSKLGLTGFVTVARVDRVTGRNTRWRYRRPSVMESLSLVISGGAVLVYYTDPKHDG
jgi:hypothetical protein